MMVESLNDPRKALLVSLVIFVLWLVSSQFIHQYYQLWSYQVTLGDKFEQLMVDVKSLKTELKVIQEKEFIKKHALENLGLLQEQDLVFIFPN